MQLISRQNSLYRIQKINYRTCSKMCTKKTHHKIKIDKKSLDRQNLF